MDILENEETQVDDQTGKYLIKPDEWKPFRIEKCADCGKVPSVIRQENVKGEGRYTIRCCSRYVKANTETKAICVWNTYQELEV